MKQYKKNKRTSIKKNNLWLILLAICLVLFFGRLVSETNLSQPTTDQNIQEVTSEIKYHFASDDALIDHFKKHGKAMGYKTANEYEAGANALILNENALHKKEKEDKDDVYYLEKTNEIAFVSNEGMIRTYFQPDKGKKYFDAQ